MDEITEKLKNIKLDNIKEKQTIIIQKNVRGFIIRKNYLFLKISRIIRKNKYINNCSSNKKIDINSLSYLIDYELSQSDCIKIGIGIENILKDFILENTNLKNIKTKNKKGIKEKDHLFMDINKKIIYYAEIKSNLNLDTEKSKQTYKKCLDIEKELQKEYKDYEIKMFLVGVRYYEKIIIPKTILKKYKEINNNLCGINEYFKYLSIKFKIFNEKDYKKILNYLVKKMFKY